MKAAGLIENPQRGIFVITKAGKDLLASKPNKVDLKLLQTYITYQEFRNRHKPKKETDEKEPETEEETKTPEERIEEAYEILRES